MFRGALVPRVYSVNRNTGETVHRACKYDSNINICLRHWTTAMRAGFNIYYMCDIIILYGYHIAVACFFRISNMFITSLRPLFLSVIYFY